MNDEISQKTGMKRLIELAATKKGFVITSIVLASLAAIASFIPFISIYKIVTILIYNYNQNIDYNEIINYGWLAFGGVVANMVLYFAALAFSHLAAFSTLYYLKMNFLSHLAKVPLGFHVLVGSGKLRKIVDENIEKIEEFIAHQLPDIIASFVAPIVMFVILFAVDWRFGIATLIGLLIAIFIQIRAFGNESSRQMMSTYQKSIEKMNNATVEYIRGISVIKAFKQTVYSFQSLAKTIKEYTEMVIPYTLSWEKLFSFFNALINNLYLFIVLAALIIGPMSNDYAMFASNFIFYLIFVPSIASILMKVMYVNSNSMRIINGVEAMDEILATPELNNKRSEVKLMNYDIEFKNVSFAYDNRENVLKDINFKAKQGEVLAIVGPSGGGKSTIAHLIPRFFDIREGEILINNIDIRDISREQLMDQVSFVFQDNFLFKQSIKDNIKIGNENASDEEVIVAAKAAQAHDFIMSLDNGYDTIIGIDNVHLSGGEKQRIAITRAIVKNAPIIVLDEATAFSDAKNERLIQKALNNLTKNKTTIMIAHRLSTIKNADQIIVVENGSIIESGKHEELIKNNKRYAMMWLSYNQAKQWKIQSKEEIANV